MMGNGSDRYFDLYDLAPVGYVTVSERGLITEANLRASRMMGSSRDALVGQPVSHFIVAEDQDVYALHHKKLFETRTRQVLELRMRPPDGSSFWARLEASVACDEDDNSPVARLTATDITEQRALQVALARAKRVVSLGRLAAGVAHEINNPLTFVLHNVETLAKDLWQLAGAAGSLRKALRESAGIDALTELIDDGAALIDPVAIANLAQRAAQTVAGTQRISETVKGLNVLARPEKTELSLLDLNKAVELAIRMTENEVHCRARLITELGRVPPVTASEGRLSQIFVNLLVNAAQAIDEGAVADNRITVRTWGEPGQAFVEVADTGHGIAPGDLDAVFEPFFTTKGPERGTGLGLAIARSIVHDMDGDIHITSTVDEGTQVLVRLPVRRVPTGRHAFMPTRPPADTSAVRGRILVVDDETSVCDVVEDILSRDHEIVTVYSGRAAKELLARDHRFDAVLCDLMMTDVSGADLHAWLSESHPRLAARLVFITGGVFTARTQDYLDGVSNQVVTKPFDIEGLQSVVRELVTAARAST